MPHPALPAPRSEEQLLERAAALAGRSLGQVAARFGLTIPADSRQRKGWTGQLMELCLGADAASLPQPDFQEIGVELKTIPINALGRPKESTYVCMAHLVEDAGTWETSLVRRKLQRVLWMPVEAAPAIPIASRRVGSAFLWSPSVIQESMLRSDWEELTEMIALGELDNISSRHGRALQIRPKAANARALTRAFNSDGAPAATLPRGFYLRTSFTAAILHDLTAVKS